MLIKFIYSEKATKFCEISAVDLSYVVPVKSTVEISQNFAAFSKYMNFKNNFWTKLESSGHSVQAEAIFVEQFGIIANFL